jgi:predicted TIM-barrel fold metal-dependent hydrolase
MPGWPGWSVEDHVALMDENNIAQAILSISSPGVHFDDDDAAAALARYVNDYAAAIVRENPYRFSFFASVPLPAVAAAVDEAAHAIDGRCWSSCSKPPEPSPIWSSLPCRSAIPVSAS